MSFDQQQIDSAIHMLNSYLGLLSAHVQSTASMLYSSVAESVTETVRSGHTVSFDSQHFADPRLAFTTFFPFLASLRPLSNPVHTFLCVWLIYALFSLIWVCLRSIYGVSMWSFRSFFVALIATVSYYFFLPFISVELGLPPLRS